MVECYDQTASDLCTENDLFEQKKVLNSNYYREVERAKEREKR